MSKIIKGNGWQILPSGTSIFDNVSEEEIKKIIRNLEEFKEKICECGSEKVHGKNALHVDYCPKYKE